MTRARPALARYAEAVHMWAHGFDTADIAEGAGGARGRRRWLDRQLSRPGAGSARRARRRGGRAMTPVTWHRASHGCELARLGVVDVGVIQPQGDGPSYWLWRVFLPMAPTRWRKADTVEQAREQLLAGVAAWLDAAHLEPMRGRAA
ncbi:MAG: hypothetical protein M5U08_13825 [Burkholderiales bacterium]|nr:hypothetical protein [Burkholderiales bacterium]